MNSAWICRRLLPEFWGKKVMKGQADFSDAIKRDAVAQLTKRAYSVVAESKHLGVSPHVLYAWKKNCQGLRILMTATT